MAWNLPVVITNVGTDWPARVEWCDRSGLRLEILKARYGHALAPVVGKSIEYGDESRDDVAVATYLDWLASGLAEADQLYLKDWHFTRDFPKDAIYTTPKYFADDWLNWWWDQKAATLPATSVGLDDYRFVYLGPRGSFTPLHHDVFQSYSWSINMTGQKEWLLFPPSETPKLLDKFGRVVLSNFQEIDPVRFPRAHTAKHLRVLQPPGAALFVPSGWYHQVTNTATTLSINHNWFNAYNLPLIWAYFQEQLLAVEREIEHCRDGFDSDADWILHCQLLLRANIGMDFKELHALLEARAAISTAPFDVAQIHEVLVPLRVHPAIKGTYVHK
ncbi:hypothetical protein SDRG_00493 [Saprolegnia diclina VS20]|uniref:JmjC domain-containing protein n=2 Tax=Saprolegnia diclina (strain VS20) TaxID=1156394 RepID=T0R8H1_SAPDV|nr:hypothetical protein SDRG_00493 [Saprolegnia diclina VS20]EQC42770.1 hypothetical protein SDRG_00493 [Saprolegnia diclina VS20]|eukprot:XP_008604193.1 hypothetical protein SDRG_00493 [Saprolegnia diclina VS20]